MGDKILAILYPGCVFFEIALALELLHEALPVEVAGPEGVARIDCSGLSVAPDLGFGQVRPADYRAVLVPGGDPGSVMENGELDDVLRSAHAGGALLAGICGGVLVLAKAGVLVERRITHTYTLDHGPREIVDATERFFAGTVYAGGPLVEHGTVITAEPGAFVEFAVLLAERLGIVDADRAAGLRGYYRDRRSRWSGS